MKLQAIISSGPQLFMPVQGETSALLNASVQAWKRFQVHEMSRVGWEELTHINMLTPYISLKDKHTKYHPFMDHISLIYKKDWVLYLHSQNKNKHNYFLSICSVARTLCAHSELPFQQWKVTAIPVFQMWKLKISE